MGRPLPAALAACLLALCGACVYRVNIQQGNFLEAKAVDQITVGMTRSQVRFVLGTPMIADPFHADRWDYLYYYKEGKSQKLEHRQFVVYFTDEKVARTERPLGPIIDSALPKSPGA